MKTSTLVDNVSAFMESELLFNRSDYVDSADCANLTALAESAADRFDIASDGSDIPEWIFDLAFIVADEIGGFNE